MRSLSGNGSVTFPIGTKTCAAPALLKPLDKAVSRADEVLDAVKREARARKATGRQEADAGDETAAAAATDGVVDEDGPSEDEAHDGEDAIDAPA